MPGEIGQYPGDSPAYLLRISGDGQIADTNHEAREEAIDRAQWEFEVLESDWEVIQPDSDRVLSRSG